MHEDQVLHKDWWLFANEGDFVFVDQAKEAALADHEFGWGAVFEDFNLDGLDDLAVSENYVGFPLHKVPAWRLDGRFMLQTENGEFAEVGTEAGVRNRAYGISPLVADFNAGGYPDLVHVNLLGPQNVFISEGGTQGYLKVSLPNTVDSIGAEISVRLDDERLFNQTFIVGEGLVSDQTHILTFGLGQQQVSNVQVRWLDGRTSTLTGPFHNESVTP